MAASVRWGVNITYRGIHGKAGVRKMRKFTRDAMKAAGLEWWRRFLPKRFLPGAQRKFQMSAGSPAYDEFKKRVQGMRISRWAGQPITPIWIARNQPRRYVLTGKTAMMTASRLTLTGTYKKIKVKFPVPRYFLRSRDAQERRKDLLKLTPKELRAMSQIVDRYIGRKIKADRTVTRKTIKA